MVPWSRNSFTKIESLQFVLSIQEPLQQVPYDVLGQTITILSVYHSGETAWWLVKYGLFIPPWRDEVITQALYTLAVMYLMYQSYIRKFLCYFKGTVKVKGWVGVPAISLNAPTLLGLSLTAGSGRHWLRGIYCSHRP